jgi:hypothetical protein
MVNKTWHLVEQHGCWWAYEGELPPPEAFTTHRRSGHLLILGPFPSRPMAEARLQRPSVWSQARSPGQPLSSTSARMAILMSFALRYRAHPAKWRDGDYDVLENGVVVGRIFCLDAVGPQGRPWMWASGHNGDIRRAAHGYEATREAAMATFGKTGGTYRDSELVS